MTNSPPSGTPSTGAKSMRPVLLGAAALIMAGSMSAFAATTVSGAGRASGFMAASLAALMAAKNPPATPAPAPASAGIRATQIGINVGGIEYYGNQRAFGNLIYGGTWTLIDSNGWNDLPARYIDADGWVRSIPAGATLGRHLSHPIVPVGGLAVTCRYEGSGSINVIGLISDQRHSAGQVSFKVQSRYPRRENLVLTWSVNSADPIRNLDCRESDGSSNSTFNSDFIASLRGYKVLRFMDWQLTNSNPQVSWASRNRPGYGDFIKRDGVPLEHMVELSNLVDADPWFNISWNADDTYVRGMATYLRDNVPANRKIYIEVSNEVWNAVFGISQQARREGLERRLHADWYEASLLRYSERMTEVMKIVTEVFAGQEHRVVRVAGAMNDNPWVAEVVLGFRDSARWVDAVATAPYFGHDAMQPSATTDLNVIFSRMRGEMARMFDKAQQNKALATRYGKRFIAYEGGQHVLVPNDLNTMSALNRDPRMYGLYQEYLDTWRSQIGDTVALYTDLGPISGWGAWGMREYAGQPLSEAPKLQATRDAMFK